MSDLPWTGPASAQPRTALRSGLRQLPTSLVTYVRQIQAEHGDLVANELLDYFHFTYGLTEPMAPDERTLVAVGGAATTRSRPASLLPAHEAILIGSLNVQAPIADTIRSRAGRTAALE